MKRFSFKDRALHQLAALAVCTLAIPALVGCSQSEAPVFRLNLQGRSPADLQLTGSEKDEAEKEAKQQIETSLKTVSTVLYAMFGEPNAPFVMPETGLDQRKIELASGAAGRKVSAGRGDCIVSIVPTATASVATAPGRPRPS